MKFQTRPCHTQKCPKGSWLDASLFNWQGLVSYIKYALCSRFKRIWMAFLLGGRHIRFRSILCAHSILYALLYVRQICGNFWELDSVKFDKYTVESAKSLCFGEFLLWVIYAIFPLWTDDMDSYRIKSHRVKNFASTWVLAIQIGQSSRILFGHV